MLNFSIATAEWHVCTPNLFRFLEEEFVDAFFKDGTIQLSSFSRFRKHKDEQRRDEHEGETYYVETTGKQEGQTIELLTKHGNDAYILCCCMRYDARLVESLGYDSYFKVNDSTQFGIAIAKHVPNLKRAFEGPCIYQNMKILYKETGQNPKNIQDFKDNKGSVEFDRLAQSVTGQHSPHLPYFLKDDFFAHQVEYRFVFLVSSSAEETIIIKAPEAIKFCEKSNELTAGR